ncbi:hypothetical protein DH2020_012254 [Rehmannia glutinosa]|uniref:Uncharacterized protein n=1 Tax=Rehmannia glutinosa TaxID=99300 RepID=A0ABR0WZF6_REHGL
MDSSSKFAGAIVTPTKEKTTNSNRSKLNENAKCSENFDPNISSPGLKFCRSPSIIKSAGSAKKPVSRKANPNQLASPSPKKKIRERKFVVAKKKLRNEEVNSSGAAVVCVKCKKETGKSKCLCVAYESLRASQDEFFKNRGEIENEFDLDKVRECDDGSENEDIKANPVGQNTGIDNEGEKERNDDSSESNGENGELGLKRSRDRLLEEARKSVPEAGSGRVMHLVKAFEKLRMMPKSVVSEEKEVEDDKKVVKWALPGLQQPPKVSEAQIFSSSSSSPSDFYLTSESLGLDSGRSYSLDSSQGRGRCKEEEEFMKKLHQMLEEEEKLRVPNAQGLPWTTDEPVR